MPKMQPLLRCGLLHYRLHVTVNAAVVVSPLEVLRCDARRY
jgi:hypothetical protein